MPIDAHDFPVFPFLGHWQSFGLKVVYGGEENYLLSVYYMTSAVRVFLTIVTIPILQIKKGG